MGTQRKILANSSINIICNLGSTLLKFFAVYFIIRHLDKESYGKYQTIISYITILTVLTDLGINNIVIREISSERSLIRLHLSNAIVMRLCLGGLVYLFSLLLIWVFHYFQPMKYDMQVIKLVSLTSFIFFVLPINQSLEAFFRIEMKMVFSGIANIVGGLFFYGCALLLIKRNSGLNGFVISWAVMFVLIMISLMAFSMSRFKFMPSVDFKLWKKLFITALPLGLSVAFGFIYFRIDTLMISWIKEEVSVANYNTAHKFVEISAIIPNSLMLVVYPLMSKYFQTDMNKLRLLYRRSIDWMVLLGLPMAIIVSMYSVEFITIFGQKYSDANYALQILIWTAFLTFPGHVLGPMTIAVHKQKYYPYITGAGVLINVGLNYVLIQKYDYNGAAAATLVTEVMICVMFLAVMRSALKKALWFSSIFKYIIANLIIAGVLYAAKKTGMHMVLSICICVPVYGVILLILKDESLKGLFAILRRKSV